MPLLGGQIVAQGTVAEVVAHDVQYQLTTLDLGGQALTMPMLGELPLGVDVRLRIRARDVAIATQRLEHLSIRNSLECTVVELVEEADSPYAELLLKVDDQRLRARITPALSASAAMPLVTASSGFPCSDGRFDPRATSTILRVGGGFLPDSGSGDTCGTMKKPYF